MATRNDSEAEPRPLRPPGPLARFFLQVAGIQGDEVPTLWERIVYATIGFFICFFGLYGSFAFLALLSRSGAIHIGRLDAGTVVAVVASVLVALAFAMFDRSLVAQVNSNLRSIRRPADDFLHPVGPRKLRLFIGRASIALLISLFATQSVDLFIFAQDIQSEKNTERLAEAKRELIATEQAQVTADSTYGKRQESLLKSAERAAQEARPARRGQHGHCRPNTQCAKRTAASDKAYAEYENLKKGPQSTGSTYVTTENKLTTEIAELRNNPSRATGSARGPLEDVAALYRYFERHHLAFLYYLAIMLILVAVDLAALLLKYFVAHDSEYERRQVAWQRKRWRQTADAVEREARFARHTPEEEAREQQYAEEIRDERAQVRHASDQAELRLLMEAYRAAATDRELYNTAEREARRNLAGSMRYTSERFRRAAAMAQDPDLSGKGALADAPHEDDLDTAIVEDHEARRPIDRSLALEILGVAAGISALVYFLGGVYLYGQFKQASLPTSALGDVSAGQIIVSGALVALVGLPLILGLSWALEAMFVRLQDASGVGSFKFSKLIGLALLAWQLAWMRIRSFFQAPDAHDAQAADVAKATDMTRAANAAETPSSSKSLALTSPQIVGGTVAATAVLTAGELTDSTVTAIAAGVTGLSTVLLGFLLLALLGWVRPHSRGFRGAVLAIAVIGTVFGAYWIAKRQAFELPDATVKLVFQGACLQGRFLNQNASNTYLIDGDDHTLRVIPARAIAGIVVMPHSQPVRGSAVKAVACPPSMERLTR